jgi:hypothetical protein
VSERQVPFYCPYCGEEDLVPAGPDPGAWRCGSCTRTFGLRSIDASPVRGSLEHRSLEGA